MKTDFVLLITKENNNKGKISTNSTLAKLSNHNGGRPKNKDKGTYEGVKQNRNGTTIDLGIRSANFINNKCRNIK